MKKALKVMAILFAGLLSLLIILAVVLTLVFDPNEYKGEIVQAVKEKTGRELRIDGKIGWSFFPWVGIEVGRLELSNAAGFGAEPFARIDAAGAKVKLLPLLRKQVIIDTVLLDGLKLNLARNAAGKTNWDDLTAPTKVEKAPEKTIPGKEPGIGGIGINKVDIRKADVTWKDQASGASYAVHNLDLKTGKIIGSKPVNVQLSFDLESGQPPVRTRVNLKTQMSLAIEEQKLEVASLTLSVGDLTLLANFKGNRVFDAPAFNGTLEISPFSPRALMDKLGSKVETTDKNALNKLSLKTRFSATTNSAELKDLAITLDESRLTGSLAIKNFAKPAFQFDLALDQIDLDRYLPPAAPATVSGSKPEAAPVKPVELPLSALRTLAVQGDEPAFERCADTDHSGQWADYARSQSGQALQRKIRRPHHPRRAWQDSDARDRRVCQRCESGADAQGCLGIRQIRRDGELKRQSHGSGSERQSDQGNAQRRGVLCRTEGSHQGCGPEENDRHH